MSRGFFGSGGTGGGSNRTKNKKSTMASMMALSNKRKKTQAEMIKERTTHQMPSYQEMLQDMLDEKMTSGSRSGQFYLPGTTPPEEKEMSKGRQMAIEHYKMKRMRQRMKIRDNKVEVIPKNYGGESGGWIDKTGKIRNKNGMVVMEVNLTNGEIRNNMGLKVGKYNPNSVSNDFKIQRLIDKYTAAQGVFNPFAGKGD